MIAAKILGKITAEVVGTPKLMTGAAPDKTVFAKLSFRASSPFLTW